MAADDAATALAALEGLLGEYRQGNIVALSAERMGMEQHAGPLTARWDERFPGFPSDTFPYTSFRGQHYRGRRDSYLKEIIVESLGGRGGDATIIVNPACVFGRHARNLASRLPRATVVATDIDPGWQRLYRLARMGRLPANYTFVKDDIFDSHLDLEPTAVVFFGACGAVSDAAIDYAISRGATFLMCRTCCHDNIGGNVAITRRPGGVNRFFRFKNWAYGRMRTSARFAGFYFSDRYSPRAYPRSEAARDVTTADELLAVARDSADSDICRAIIDLDRYVHLVEKGFGVLYQGEMFVAERKAQTGSSRPAGSLAGRPSA